MKKLVFVLFLFIGISAEAYNPIRPYNENGYSKEDVNKFALSSTKLSVNFRTEMLRLVNLGLSITKETSKLNYPLTASNISWIIDHVSYEKISLPAGYTNSYEKNDSIFFYKDDKPFEGVVGIFTYGKCRLVLFKTICMNLLEIPIIFQENPEKEVGVNEQEIINPIIINPNDYVYREPVKETEPVEQKPAASVVNQYYVYGYDDTGDAILCDLLAEMLYFYSSPNCYYPVPFTRARGWGCYPTYNDYCYHRGYGTVGSYYNNVITNITNIHNTNINNNNYTNNYHRTTNHNNYPNNGDTGGPGGAQQNTNVGGNNNPGGAYPNAGTGNNYGPGGANTVKSARVGTNSSSSRSGSYVGNASRRSSNSSQSYRASSFANLKSAVSTSSKSYRRSSSYISPYGNNRSSSYRPSYNSAPRFSGGSSVRMSRPSGFSGGSSMRSVGGSSRSGGRR